MHRVLIIIFILLINIRFMFGQPVAIKPGDIIEIIVVGNEPMSQSVIVKPDGTVDYPALQGLPIDGISLQRLQEILITQLSRYFETTPLVFTRFGDSYLIRVTILGQVAMPGLYPIASTATLQGAISAAGGLIPGAQLANIKIIRMENQQRTELSVNMENFYLKGDPSTLPALKDGDTIIISGNPLATKVKVIGSVVNPGNYDVFLQNTILDVIFLAGGPAEDANLKKVRVISLNSGAPREINLNYKELLKANNLQRTPVVIPGDVVYVPKRMVTWRKTLNVLRDLTTFATLYYLISMTQD